MHVSQHYPWEPRLAELLQSFERPLEETGAELEITWPDGGVGVWPLARHYRVEEREDGLATLWLRPVMGGYDNPEGSPARAFSLATMRRHAFCVDELHATARRGGSDGPALHYVSPRRGWNLRQPGCLGETRGFTCPPRGGFAPWRGPDVGDGRRVGRGEVAVPSRADGRDRHHC